MKNLYLLFVFCFIFVSCSNMNLTKDGQQCFHVQNFEVLQGLEGGALAYECPWYESMCWTLPVVYLTSPKGVDYYDEQMVTNDKYTCWVQDGIYRYSTTKGVMKTVPLLKMLNKN